MSSSSKLSKKQKKGLAFRQRKGKGKDEVLDVPVIEDQDFAELDDEPTPESRQKGEGSSHKVDDETPKDRKRKRHDGDSAAPRPESTKEPKTKRRRKEDEVEGGEDNAKVKSTSRSETKASKKSRFILFVGNLKYTTTIDAILEHFAICDPPPTVRLLTPKTTKSPVTSKSKGCAFLEFSHRNALQQALKLHHSDLDGRKINVELTAGGGGKGETRLNKVKERNQGLASQRIKKQPKELEGSTEPAVGLADRHSSTSGVEKVQTKLRTWSVGDVDSQTHRGGQKHDKSRKKRGLPRKPMGTGVNAIPVG